MLKALVLQRCDIAQRRCPGWHLAAVLTSTNDSVTGLRKPNAVPHIKRWKRIFECLRRSPGVSLESGSGLEPGEGGHESESQKPHHERTSGRVGLACHPRRYAGGSRSFMVKARGASLSTPVGTAEPGAALIPIAVGSGSRPLSTAV